MCPGSTLYPTQRRSTITPGLWYARTALRPVLGVSVFLCLHSMFKGLRLHVESSLRFLQLEEKHRICACVIRNNISCMTSVCPDWSNAPLWAVEEDKSFNFLQTSANVHPIFFTHLCICVCVVAAPPFTVSCLSVGGRQTELWHPRSTDLYLSAHTVSFMFFFRADLWAAPPGLSHW